VLPPETQFRVDELLRQIQVILDFIHNTPARVDDVGPADSHIETIKSFEVAFKSIADTLHNTVTPRSVSDFLNSFDRIATTFQRTITSETPIHLENTLRSIESTFSNIDAITSHVRDFTNIVGVLVIGLGVSVLFNIMLVFYVRGKDRAIARLKEGRKKAM